MSSEVVPWCVSLSEMQITEGRFLPAVVFVVSSCATGHVYGVIWTIAEKKNCNTRKNREWCEKGILRRSDSFKREDIVTERREHFLELNGHVCWACSILSSRFKVNCSMLAVLTS